MTVFIDRTVLLIIALLSCACATSAVAQEITPLEVHFIDVGTGDCIWIRTGDDGIDGNGKFEGMNIVIDGGDWGRGNRINGFEYASAYLQEEGKNRLPKDSKIDWMILTHPHSDHCGGLFGILTDYDVANILDPGHDKRNGEGLLDRLKANSSYGRFYQKAKAEVLADGTKANFLWGVPDDLQLDWGDELNAEVLWSSSEIVDGDLNNTSIVLRLAYKDVSFLFTGDAEHFVEHHLVETLGDGLRSTVLKAGHHGSNSSTTKEFLRAVRPKHVVISSGNHKFSGTMLPREETSVRIKNVSDELGLDTQLWRTDLDDKNPLKASKTEGGDDNVVITTDGSTVSIGYVAVGGDTTLLAVDRCQAITLSGTQCKRKPSEGSKYCWQHQD